MEFRESIKFGVVIGNPPYNNGMDIDFAFVSFELCNKYLIMITPGKWQTAEDNQLINSKNSYSDFRRYIVPYIKKVKFYPDSYDVFNIRVISGITYYLVDKNKKKEDLAEVENLSKHNKYLNTVRYRNIKNSETLVNVGNDLIDYLGNYERFKFNNDLDCKYILNFGNMLANSGAKNNYNGGSLLFSNNGDVFITSVGRILLNGEKSIIGASKNIFSSDNIEECKSYISYINTRLVRFMLFINLSKINNILTDNYFRFVPSIPKDINGRYILNHTYTDDEVYELFGLNNTNAVTKEGIPFKEIINSIIKEKH